MFRILMEMLARAYDALRTTLGFDAFISYARNDTFDFAMKLRAQLAQRGLETFIDQLGTSGSGNIPEHIFRKLRGSKMLIMIASTATLRNENVLREVLEFPSDHRVVHIVDVGGIADQAIWFDRIKGAPRIHVAPSSLGDDTCLLQVAERLVESANFIRVTKRRAMLIVGLVAILGGLLFGGLRMLQVIQEKVKQNDALDVENRKSASTRQSLENDILGIKKTRLELVEANDLAKKKVAAREKLIEAADAELHFQPNIARERITESCLLLNDEECRRNKAKLSQWHFSKRTIPVPEGKFFASIVDTDGRLRIANSLGLLIYNFRAGRYEKMSSPGFPHESMAAVFSESGGHVGFSDKEYSYVYAIGNGRQPVRVRGRILAISSKGKYAFLYHGIGESTTVWNLESDREVFRFGNGLGNFTFNKFSPDEKYLVTDKSGAIATHSQNRVHVLSLDAAVAIAPVARTKVGTTQTQDRVNQPSPSDAALRTQLNEGESISGLTFAHFFDDGKRLLTYSRSHGVKIVAMASGDVLSGSVEKCSAGESMQFFQAAHELFGCLSTKGLFKVWSLKNPEYAAAIEFEWRTTGHMLDTLVDPELGEIRALSSDGSLATYSLDGTLLYAGRSVIQPLKLRSLLNNSVIAAVSDSGAVEVWGSEPALVTRVFRSRSAKANYLSGTEHVGEIFLTRCEESSESKCSLFGLRSWRSHFLPLGGNVVASSPAGDRVLLRYGSASIGDLSTKWELGLIDTRGISRLPIEGVVVSKNIELNAFLVRLRPVEAESISSLQVQPTQNPNAENNAAVLVPPDPNPAGQRRRRRIAETDRPEAISRVQSQQVARYKLLFVDKAMKKHSVEVKTHLVKDVIGVFSKSDMDVPNASVLGGGQYYVERNVRSGSLSFFSSLGGRAVLTLARKHAGYVGAEGIEDLGLTRIGNSTSRFISEGQVVNLQARIAHTLKTSAAELKLSSACELKDGRIVGHATRDMSSQQPGDVLHYIAIAALPVGQHVVAPLWQKRVETRNNMNISVRCADDANIAVIGANDGKLTLLDASNNTTEKIVKVLGRDISSFAISPTGQYLFLRLKDGSLYCWSYELDSFAQLPGMVRAGSGIFVSDREIVIYSESGANRMKNPFLQ